MVYHCTIEQEGDMYIAQFPDMPNIQTFGTTLEEALAMAKEAIFLRGIQSRRRPIREGILLLWQTILFCR